MSKKVSACRTEVRVVYHCEIGNKCNFFERTGSSWQCNHLLNTPEHFTCTLRAAQRAGRKAARQRGAQA